MVRSLKGYQVLVSFELDEPAVQWSGRLAGIDINPERVACSVVSSDGNIIVTRFFRDRRLITASKNKRKWVLENLVNRMLKWCRDARGCNAIAVESQVQGGVRQFSSDELQAIELYEAEDAPDRRAARPEDEHAFR